jgi:hypothetical protein
MLRLPQVGESHCENACRSGTDDRVHPRNISPSRPADNADSRSGGLGSLSGGSAPDLS